ncbi:MAG: hypothetical protein ACTSRA_00090 [Promethearchaeota archaeon]|nr:MAG: hypothetical protein [Helarchaeota virus Nidhogg Meg22_1012]URC17356.1 MAG: hypothetical protein [Helarchaeota virus Nidhogg Meg22_1214]
MLLIGTENSDDFEDDDIESIVRFGADMAIYHYECYPYEGSGYLLMKKGLVWFLLDLYHCSCYGPMDDIENKSVRYETIEELKDKASDELLDDIKPLLNLIPPEWLRSDAYRRGP